MFATTRQLQRTLASRVVASRYLSSSAAHSQKIALTFFTKDTCMLCTKAKGVLKSTLENDALKGEEIDLKVVDIMHPDNGTWFEAYCYDVPVLHVDRPSQNKPVKFMHYFDEEKLVKELTKDKA
ncbi:uncharacterized protein RJT20DRAFT_129044 [Scheffersomyces xylosifermentans]|uniref:uncharacterized protein n=1 Tax=Scheffersomyces xylosifermentans TaxID=1304137 RepID=UPI00315D6101